MNTPTRSNEELRWHRCYGPTAVVTGASSGIGRDIAERLAAAGFDLVLVARRAAVLDALAEELSASHDITVHPLASDMAHEAGWQSLLEFTGTMDVGLLVAAAGFGTSGSFIDNDVEQELNMLDVNCRAVVRLAHGFSRRFVERGRGGIVLFGSLVGWQGVPNAANYAATKAWVQSFAEGLHHELSAKGVDVVSSAPGPVHSGFADRADMRMGAALTPSQVGEATLRALGRRVTVQPGFLTKFLSGSLATLPRFLRVRVMQQVMGGMTGHQTPSNRALSADAAE